MKKEVYARSKRAAEDYILEFNKIYNINFTILRFGSLYGEGQTQIMELTN